MCPNCFKPFGHINLAQKINVIILGGYLGKDGILYYNYLTKPLDLCNLQKTMCPNCTKIKTSRIQLLTIGNLVYSPLRGLIHLFVVIFYKSLKLCYYTHNPCFWVLGLNPSHAIRRVARFFILIYIVSRIVSIGFTYIREFLVLQNFYKTFYFKFTRRYPVLKMSIFVKDVARNYFIRNV